MLGFDAFKLWVAMKQHFTTKNFDIFQNKGRMKGKYETFLARSDGPVIEYVASKFEIRDFVYYLASNFIYGNEQCIWEFGQGAANYNLFIARKKVLGNVVANDFKSLDNMNIAYNDGIGVIRALTRNQITIETASVINQVINLTDQLRPLPVGKMVEPLLMRIDKSKGFIKVPSGVEKYILTNITF